MKFTIDNIATQIEAMKGNVSAVARSFGKTRKAVYDKIKISEKLQKVLADSRETMIDNVESKLYSKALEGDTTSMIFFLKTQGKSRGYTERQEVEVRGWQDKVIDALRENKITAEKVKERFGDKLAKELFARAGINAR